MATLIAGLTRAELSSQLRGLHPKTLSEILDFMAKEFETKRRKFKDVASAVKYIMDTDNEDLNEFILDVEKKKINKFVRGGNMYKGVPSKPLSHKPTKLPKASKPAKASKSSGNKLTEFRGQAILRNIKSDALAALQEVADKYGILVDAQNGSFDSSRFSFKLNFKIAGDREDGLADADQKAWNSLCSYTDGLTPSMFGKQFRTARGEFLTIIGTNPRAPRYPIRLRDNNGRTVRASAAYVLQNWK